MEGYQLKREVRRGVVRRGEERKYGTAQHTYTHTTQRTHNTTHTMHTTYTSIHIIHNIEIE